MGTRSVRNALVPVGRNPVDKPCNRRMTKKADTVYAASSSQPTPMYASPAKAVTAVPNNMTGLRPARSAIRPEKNLLKNAPTVNSATIHPIKCPASYVSRYPGSSGRSIPKLAMNRTVPAQRSQKVGVNTRCSKAAKVLFPFGFRSFVPWPNATPPKCCSPGVKPSQGTTICEIGFSVMATPSWACSYTHCTTNLLHAIGFTTKDIQN